MDLVVQNLLNLSVLFSHRRSTQSSIITTIMSKIQNRPGEVVVSRMYIPISA